MTSYSAAIAEELIRHSCFSDIAAIGKLCSLILVAACAIALLKFALDLYEHLVTKRTIVITVLGFAYIAFMFFRGQSDAIMLMWIFIVSSHNVSFDRLINYAAKTMMITILFVFACGSLGLIGNDASSRIRDGVEFVRGGIGFQFYYQASYFFFCAHLAWMYYRKDQLSWYEIITLSAIEVYVFRQTDTRGPFLLAVLLIMVTVLQKLFPILRSYMKGYTAIGIASPILCSGLVVGQSILIKPTGSEFLRMLNEKLTQRLQLNYDGYKSFGIKFWGQNIQWSIAQGYNWVDSVYLYSLLSYGIPFMLGFFAIVVSLVINAWKKHDSYLIIAVILISLLGIWDNYCFRIECDPFLMFFAYGHICEQKK